MNKQHKGEGRRGIEWTDYTWNPVGGCKHGCRWVMPDGSKAICYAEAVAEGVARAAYPDGFTAHYWTPERLNEPGKLQTPARIFLDSMSDLMGHWIPAEQIEAVLDVCRNTPQHTFQLLTKNAARLLQFQFPANVWVGVSMPPTEMNGRRLEFHQQEAYMRRAMEVLSQVSVPVRWVSFEPLSFNVAGVVSMYPRAIQWAVIGAASRGSDYFQPDPVWVRMLHNALDDYGVSVFHKGNLEWEPRREEFPDRQVEPSPVMEQMKLL